MSDYLNIIVFGGFLILFLVAFVALYVIMALALMKMANKLGIANPWLAWIPVANIYLMAKLAGDKVKLMSWEFRSVGVLLVGCYVVSAVINVIPIIGSIISILLSLLSLVLTVLVMHKIFRTFVGSSATVYVVVSLVLAIIAPILYMVAAGNEPDYSVHNESYEGFTVIDIMDIINGGKGRVHPGPGAGPNIYDATATAEEVKNGDVK